MSFCALRIQNISSSKACSLSDLNPGEKVEESCIKLSQGMRKLWSHKWKTFPLSYIIYGMMKYNLEIVICFLPYSLVSVVTVTS